MKGVGPATVAKLRDLDRRGGWMYADDWFALHGSRGNRLPLIMKLGLMDSFGLCKLGDRDLGWARVAYRLTDEGRAYLAAAQEG